MTLTVKHVVRRFHAASLISGTLISVSGLSQTGPATPAQKGGVRSTCGDAQISILQSLREQLYAYFLPTLSSNFNGLYLFLTRLIAG
jgi:hypothetical protein